MNFEDMFKKLSPTLRRIAHKLNGRFTFFDENDLFQEALAHLWVAFNKGTLTDKTDSYILQGCYYYLKNHIRTNLDKASFTSLNELLEGGDSSLEELIPDTTSKSTPDCIDETLMQEYTEKHLDGREKEILNLACEGLTVREIGERLNISHVMVVKIRRRLKTKVAHFKDDRGYQN